MSRKPLFTTVLLILTLLLGGCWDRREMEDQAYIMLMGLDRAESDELIVSVLVALVPQIASGAMNAPVQPSGTFLASRMLVAKAATVTQAIHILNGGMTRRLDPRHMRGVVVSQALAREGLEPILMELHREPMMRTNVILAQATGTAREVLEALKPVTEVNPSRMAEGYLLQTKSLHLAPPTRMHHFLSRLSVPGGDPFVAGIAVNWDVVRGTGLESGNGESALPGELTREGGNPVELVGTAIYRGDRLVGFLDVDETQLFLALRGAMGKAYVTLPDPDHPDRPVSMRFHQENLPQQQAFLAGSKPGVNVKLLLEGEQLAAPGGTDYTLPDARQRLEKAAAAYAEETARRVIAKLNDWQADPVGYGNLFRGRFRSTRGWEQFDWDERLKRLEVSIDVEMRIRRYALQAGPDRVRDGK